MEKEYTKNQIEKALESSIGLSETCRQLGCRGATLKRHMDKYGLKWEDYKNPGRKGRSRVEDRKYTADQAFQKGMHKNYALRYLKEEREWKCECCGLSEWQGKPLPLEVHHINGDCWDQRRENLQILCPNCHSLTDTWRSRNSKGYNGHSPKVSDEELLKAVEVEGNIHKALKSLGLAGVGGNYSRAQKLIANRYISKRE